MAPRYDFAVFSDDRLVANAMLTLAEVKRMERDGFRCLRVRDTEGEGLPAFRAGRTYVGSRQRDSRKWDR